MSGTTKWVRVRGQGCCPFSGFLRTEGKVSPIHTALFKDQAHIIVELKLMHSNEKKKNPLSQQQWVNFTAFLNLCSL